MGLGLGLSRNSGSPPFNPAITTPSIWLDPSDLSTMFKDTAGTTPVTTDGDAVQRINNKGSLGGFFQYAGGTGAPLYKTGGFLLFDGVDDYMYMDGVNFSEISALGMCVGHRALSTANLRAVVAHNGLNSPSWSIRQGNGDGYLFTTITDSLDQVVSPTTFPASTDAVLMIDKWDIAQANAASKMPARINGTSAGMAVAAEDGGAGTAFANTTMFIAIQSNGQPANMRLYGLIVRGTPFNATERGQIETYMAGKSGVTL